MKPTKRTCSTCKNWHRTGLRLHRAIYTIGVCDLLVANYYLEYERNHISKSYMSGKLHTKDYAGERCPYYVEAQS